MPILSVYFGGEARLRVEPGSTMPVLSFPGSGSSPLTVAWDRMELIARDNTRVVLDVAPPAGSGSLTASADNYVTVEFNVVGSERQVSAVRFQGLIRCYIAGQVGPFLAVEGKLEPDGSWLRFAAFRFGEGPASGSMPIEGIVASKAWLPVEFASPLLEEVGLRVASGGNPVQVWFVHAPRPAPADAPFLAAEKRPGKFPTWVVRFYRGAALVPCDQAIRVKPVKIWLDRRTVRETGLDGCGSNPAPLRLTQTALVFNDAETDRLTTHAGHAIVGIGGLPPEPLLIAWNECVVAPYLGSVQTVQDGRPVALLPHFDLPPMPPPCPCDPPPKGSRPPTDCLPEPHCLPADVQPILLPCPVPLEVRAGAPPAGSACADARPRVSFRAAVLEPPPSADAQNDIRYRQDVRLLAILRHDAGPQPAPIEARFALVSAIDAATGDMALGRMESVWRGFVFRARQLFPPDRQKAVPQRVRVGALDLEFPEHVPDVPAAPYRSDDWDRGVPDRQCLFQAGFREPRGLEAEHIDLPTVNIRLVLRVERLTPGGQDGLPDEPFTPAAPPGAALPPDDSPEAIAARFTREPPVIVPLALATAGRFTLVGLETTAAFQSQSLSLRLLERSGGPPAPPRADAAAAARGLDLVVVDRQPLLVARVLAPAFRGLSGADGNREVGDWSAAGFEGASWALAGATDGVPLTLPPQTIGEGTEKRARPDLDNPPGPSNWSGDVEEGRAAAFRFGPPARLRIATSYFRQNFTEAAWNLRRILGYSGQRAPGAGLLEMALELLYGLGCEVRTPGVRLAELAARLGAIPLAPPDVVSRPFGTDLETLPGLDETYRRYRLRWSYQYAVYLSRLGVFEPWSEAQPGTLTLADGVRYVLRDPTQLVRDPTNPVPPAQSVTDLLPGGALWGLDFKAQYAPFQTEKGRRSTGGELSRPALSALGGWGYQKAVFANGVTTIYSDTAMGRVFFYSVEQRGRIAGYWNFAKHVVIYERTAAPAAQFAGTIVLSVQGTTGSFTLTFDAHTTGALPLTATAAQVQAALEGLAGIGSGNVTVVSGPGSGAATLFAMSFAAAVAGKVFRKLQAAGTGGVDTAVTFNLPEQDHLPGRPVLRKVHEYVELIQPVRTYPDFEASPVSTGCVQAIEFKTRIIPVSGTWGQDVIGLVPKKDTATGKVVLNPGTKQGERELGPWGYAIPLWQPDAPPSVYPKPQVAVRLAGAEGGTLPSLIDEPQKLLFFSDPSQTTPDTDLWPAVPDVDFLDLDWPAPPAPTPDPASDLDAPVPDELPVHPGYDRFTYALVATRPVDVVAERAKQAVGALLRNVTMVRSEPAAAVGAVVDAAAGRARLADARQALSAVLTALPTGTSADQLKNSVQQQINGLTTAVADVKAKFTSVFGGAALDPARDWFGQTKGTLLRWQRDATGALQDEILARVPQELRAFSGSAAHAKALADKLLAEQLQQFALRVRSLDPGVGQLTDLLQKAQGAAGHVGPAVAAEVSAAQQRFAALLGVANDIPTVALDAALRDAIRQAADDVRRRLEARVREPLGQVIDAATRYFDPLPDAARTALGNVQAEIASRLAAVRAAVAGAAADVWTRVHELDNVLTTAQAEAKAVADKTAAVAQNLAAAAAKLLDLPATASQTVGQLVNGIGDRLRGALTLGLTAQQLAQALEQAAGGVRDAINDAVPKLLKNPQLQDFAQNGLAKVSGLFGAVNLNDVQSQVQATAQKLQDALAQVGDPDQLRQQLNGLLDQAGGQLDTLAARLADPLAAKFPDGLTQAAGNTLRLVRAFGDAPNVDGLGFNRGQLGYFFNPLRSALPGLPIDLSPVNALVNRAGDFLKATGVRLPAGQLLDQVLPPPDELMKQFDLGKLLPDFAGLKLDRLLPDLKAPDGLADKVKVTHQFDRQAGQGWVQADVRIPEAGPTSLFDAGPVAVTLRDVLLTATMRIEAGLDGAPKRTQSGKLAGTWDLVVGGNPLITFADTALTFDQSGKTKFDLDPTKIRLNGVLQMLSDALASVSDPDSGFILRLKEEGGFPVGVEALLELPLPDCSFGPCGLSNLRFGAAFELVAAPEFALGVRMHVAEKVAPFTLVIFILGGGGWFDVRARYFPLSGRITTAVSLGLSAGAELAIEFGPIKGVIYAFFYVEAELQTDSAAPGTVLTIRIGLLLGGEVDVLGLVSVCLKLLLELEYQAQSGELVGRGTLSLKIKICWLITISVNMAVEKRFGKVGGGAFVALALADVSDDAIAAAVIRYLSLLE